MNQLKYAVRQLRMNPGFTAIAVLVLALGIGANTAIYSLINTFLFKPIVAKQPDRLVGIYSHDTGRQDYSWRSFSVPNFQDIRSENKVFDDIFAMFPDQVGVTEGDTTRRVFSIVASANYFDVFGVAPYLGRTFLPEEDASPTPVVIVSHRWWERHGSDRNIIDQKIQINGRLHTIVGVAPREFSGTTPMFAPELFFPLGHTLLGVTDGSNPLLDRQKNNYILVGRLKEGIDLTAANSQLKVISDQLAAAYPDVNKNQLVTVDRLPRMAISTNPVNDRSVLARLGLLIAGLAIAVLFIACLNLANMLLSRGMARRREIAVRIAIGASRLQIVRLLLVESFLLALMGGALAIIMSRALMTWLSVSLERLTSFPLYIGTSTEWPVLLVTLGACVAATLFFALGPAIRLGRNDVNHDLKTNCGEDSRPDGRGLAFVRNSLVIGQIALSLALLVGAGLFGRSALNAMRFNPGFDLDQGLIAEIDPGLIGYDEQKARQRYAEILDRVGNLPAVDSASLAATVPLGEMSLGEGVQLAGAPFPAPADAKTVSEGMVIGATLNAIGPRYFRTLGLSLLRGREFNNSELSTNISTRVAIINTLLARKIWPDMDPADAVGRRIQIGAGGGGPGGAGVVIDGKQGPQAEVLEIVGVAAPQKNNLFEGELQPMLYLPLGQRFFSSLLLHVRAHSAASLPGLLREVRGTIHEIDSNLPILKTLTLHSHVEMNVQTWMMRAGAVLFGSLGATALLLAVLGVYGVKAYTVARRTREIGIRMALGSTTREVLRLFLGEGLKLTAIGVVIGGLLAIGVASAMGHILYEVSPFDPAVMIIAPSSLLLASLIATWIPARRAARVNPMTALRSE
ncbi:FtsX-like permease family protein [bacterium]|nr:FtsX-like permease family protein [bacterium]